MHFAKGFATGFVTGNADDVASLSGTVAGDLFVFGDIRDVVREGKHLAMGEDTDHLVLGLATAGLAVTAATYVSVGGAGPLRAGLDAGQGHPQGRTAERGIGSRGLAARRARSSTRRALRQAVSSGSVLRPGRDRRRDPRRVPRREGRRAGARRQGRRPHRQKRPVFVPRGIRSRSRRSSKELARAARIAEAKGGQTLRDRQAVSAAVRCCLPSARSISTMWLFGALLTLFDFSARSRRPPNGRRMHG